MPDQDYEAAKQLTKDIARAVGRPDFYIKENRAVERSLLLFEQEPMVRDAFRIASGYGDCYGHGLSHMRSVAIDAGAIILIESPKSLPSSDRLILLGHLAGLLHDIKREQKDHARLGAQEAEMVLKPFSLEERERLSITRAIANHEAFQSHDELADPADQLLSDALYDADKFRWGPDNFTETLWAMLAARKVPVEKLLPRFLNSLEGIRRIRETFRTVTGQTYGPDFIDRGIEIGRRFYAAATGAVR
ncbi:MAG: hypothetical protein AB2L12_01965 [Smithellaceae bacterium]